MHYVKLHLGDWALGTKGLSLLERGVYLEMLSICYAEETGLPDDLKKICKMIGAHTASEKNAVKEILSKFFQVANGLWINQRVEKELSTYKDKSSKAAASAKERWDKTHQKTDANAMRTHSGRNANQEPRTINQEPRERTEVISTGAPPGDHLDSPTPAGETCKQLARLGITGVNPHHPGLIDLLKAGITPSEIVSVAAEPKAKGKGMAWVLATVKGRRQDASQSAPLPKASVEKQWFESAGGIEQRGRELNVTLQPGEAFPMFKARVFEKADLPDEIVRKARIDAGLRP